MVGYVARVLINNAGVAILPPVSPQIIKIEWALKDVAANLGMGMGKVGTKMDELSRAFASLTPRS